MDFSLLGLWNQMGWVAKLVVIILIVMSMYAIGIALERFVAFRRGRQRSNEYIAALEPLLETRMDEAKGLQSKWSDAPLARIIGLGLGEYSKGLDELGPGSRDPVELELLLHGVGRTMERAKKRELAGLSRGLPVLATISSSGPFVGLFGTVFGIISSTTEPIPFLISFRSVGTTEKSIPSA